MRHMTEASSCKTKICCEETTASFGAGLTAKCHRSIIGVKIEVVIDSVRYCKFHLDQGLKAALVAPSAYFMKSPPVQHTDDEAHRTVEDLIAVNQGEKVSASSGQKSE